MFTHEHMDFLFVPDKATRSWISKQQKFLPLLKMQVSRLYFRPTNYESPNSFRSSTLKSVHGPEVEALI